MAIVISNRLLLEVMLFSLVVIVMLFMAFIMVMMFVRLRDM